MRKLQIILLLIMGIALTSCQKNANKPISIIEPDSWENTALLESVKRSSNGTIGNFIYVNRNDTRVSFYELSNDKYTLISIGRPISRACAEQSPALQKAHNTRDNWVILQFCTPISQNSTYDEEVAYIEDYISENDYSFIHIVPNYKSNYYNFISMFPAFSYVPANFILDKNHKIVKSFFFIAGWQDLERIMDEVETTHP